MNPTTRPYNPAPHPMAYRLKEFREIPSQWNGIIYHTIEEFNRKLNEKIQIRSA